MSDQDSKIDWAETNPANVALAISEYEKRLAAGRDLYGVLDNKARWVLTVTLPLGSALAAYLFAQQETDACLSASALTLAGLLFLSTIFAALALQTRRYRVGALIPDDISQWKPFLEGGQREARLFAEMRIRTMASAIEVNDKSNDSKADNLKRALWLACLAAPVATLPFFSCRLLFLYAIPAGICPTVVGP